MKQDLEEYLAAGKAWEAGEISVFPTGVYRAHRSIAPWECAHCGIKGDGRKRHIGYNSCLPDGHKVICGDCFYGLK